MKNSIYSILFFLLIFPSFSQQKSTLGSVKGIITDKQTGETLPFVKVTLISSSKVKKEVSSDLDGKYIFSNLQPGKYSLTSTFIGYCKIEIKEITVTAGKETIQNFALVASNVKLEEFTITKYPMIDKDKVGSYGYLSKESIAKMPGRNAGSIAATLGFYKIRENRTFYIDGIKVNKSEYYDRINENNFLAVNKEPLSTFSIDVDKASYSNMRRFINNNSLPPKDVVRIEEFINYFDYYYSAPKGEHPFSIHTEYTDCPWNKNHKLASVAIQGAKIDLDEAPANNLVFLLDVSGSMDSPDKLGLLKSGLNLLIDQLREKDKVSIVVYAGAAGVVLEPTHGDKKQIIKDALNKLQAGGSTAGGEGIQLAYKLAKKHFIKKGNNRVILATDGDFNVGISNDNALVKLIEEKRENNIFLSVLGFGTGNYKDSKMEKIADKGNGNYAYIDNILEAKKVLVKEMGGTLITIAKDVKIQIEFNPKFIKSYRLIGYENRKLANEDFNDDKKDAGELGSGHTVTALYELIPAGSNESIKGVDTLKYQKPSLQISKEYNSEIMTVKFRYKDPEGDTSKLITKIIYNEKKSFKKASENLKFASAVIEFGMLLRDSKYKGESTYQSAIKLAKSAKGKDEEGYRAEFIRLIETAELMTIPSSSVKK